LRLAALQRMRLFFYEHLGILIGGDLWKSLRVSRSTSGWSFLYEVARSMILLSVGCKADVPHNGEHSTCSPTPEIKAGRNLA
jgi:hypothetical protein